MDQYDQVGPEKPDYARDVQGVASHLMRNGVVDVKFAARNTMKHVVLALLRGPLERVMAGEVINYGGRPDGFGDQPGIFVGIADHGQSAWLPATGDLHPTYVQGYLGHPFGVERDGGDALTDFVNAVATFIYGTAYVSHLLERTCSVCGCTDRRACDPPCWWIGPDLCSNGDRAHVEAAQANPGILA